MNTGEKEGANQETDSSTENCSIRRGGGAEGGAPVGMSAESPNSPPETTSALYGNWNWYKNLEEKKDFKWKPYDFQSCTQLKSSRKQKI